MGVVNSEMGAFLKILHALCVHSVWGGTQDAWLSAPQVMS